MIKKHLTTVCLLLIILTGRGQYIPQFSQLIKTLEFVNPGYNATKTDPSATLLYRNQWTGFTGAPRSYGVNLNVPVNRLHMGFGVNAVAETRGLITQTNSAINANVDVKVADNVYLTFGLNGGIETKRIDMERAVYYDSSTPFDAKEYNNNSLYTAAGINLFAGNLHLGGGFHYTQLTGSYYNSNEPYSYYLNGSYLIDLSENWALKPSLLYRHFAGYGGLDYGVFVLYKDLIWVGAANRWNQAMIFFANFKVTRFFRLGYSYDLGIGNSFLASYGSHEINLEFTIPRAKGIFERNANQ